MWILAPGCRYMGPCGFKADIPLSPVEIFRKNEAAFQKMSQVDPGHSTVVRV